MWTLPNYLFKKEALARGLGALVQDETEILGELLPIPGFKMPVTFFAATLSEEERAEFRRLYPFRMMETRIEIKPDRKAEKCIACGDCVLNCPAQCMTMEPEFHIGDGCIACYCCVELCPEGAMEVPMWRSLGIIDRQIPSASSPRLPP